MTHVLEVVYRFDYGGIRAFIMNYLTCLDKEKFRIDIYAFGCESSPFAEQVRQLGANIYFEPENNVRNIPKFVNQLKTFMKEHGPYDVVHAHNNLISAWVLLAAKQAKVPIRLSHSHSASHFEKSLLQNGYSYIRRFLIDKLASRKLACGQLAGEAMYGRSSDFEIISNGILIDKFMNRDDQKINELRKKLNIPITAKVYANVTRLDPQKNHLFAVEVFNEIHKLEPNSIFLYGGDIPSLYPTLEAVQQKISEYKLEPYCRFTEAVMEVNHLYHMTDLWIYSSAFEGLPFGPIELQAASVPVIASDVITKEIDLGLGLVQFLSLNDSPKKWAELAISISKPSLANTVITDAFQSHNFDIKFNVSHLEKIYEGY